MSDDIVTLENEIINRLLAERDRLQGRVATLQKALDDRHAADVKAWKPIMNAAGRERGLPSNTEVVAWHVAEVERLEKELAFVSREGNRLANDLRNVKADRDSLRAKLERAKGTLECINKRASPNPERTFDKAIWDLSWITDTARNVLSELSADAPAQQTREVQLKPGWLLDDVRKAAARLKPAQRTPRDLRALPDTELAEHLADLEKQWDDLIASLEESGGHSGSPGEWLAEEMDAVCAEQKRRAHQKQISDEVREAMAEAEKALSAFNGLVTVKDCTCHECSRVRAAQVALAKLRSVMK